MKQGWEIKKLSQLFDVKSSRRVHQSDWKTSGIPFYRAREVVKLARDGMVENELFISQELYNEFTKEKGAPKTGDIIVSAVGTLGQCYLVKDSDKFYFKDASVLWFENMGKVNSQYIEYAFKADSIMAQVMDGSMGATVGTLTISRAKDIEIPLPPLPEQQLIVATLDEAFAAIAKAKANAEQNLKNAKELFESFLQGVFENKGDGWEEKTFEDVCNLVGGSQPSKDDFIYEPKEGYIRLIQVRDYRTSKYITYIPKDKARRFCSENDIMIGRYGPPIFGIFKGLQGAYNVALMKAEVNTKICNSDYFFWFLKTNKLRVFVENSSKRAAGQDGIRKELLDKYPVPLPKSLKTQQSIVQKLDALSTETKNLAAIYNQKLKDLEELKKSVLQKAFSGELKTNAVAV